MIKNYIENANFEDTGFAYTLSLISGKHKMVILYCLMEFETVRFNELKRISENYFRQNAQYQSQRAGERPTDYQDGISADPAEGGVQPFRKREVIDDCTGSTLHLGRREQIGEMISSYFFM